jgi:hypothetical protein
MSASLGFALMHHSGLRDTVPSSDGRIVKVPFWWAEAVKRLLSKIIRQFGFIGLTPIN